MRLVKIDHDVYYAQGFNSWGLLQVGMTLFRIWNGTRRHFTWRLEIATPYHWLRFTSNLWYFDIARKD